jgi:pyruvate ferredoxin oxidoreductase alpha subunit
MAVANRALSAPINIWNDHADLMYARDAGWIQIIAENGQEVVDLTIQAFRMAEDPNVMFPVQVNLDGFTLSHVIEPIIMPTKAEVDEYLPPFRPKFRLDPANPISMGPVGLPDIYTEARKAQDEAFKDSLPHIEKAWDEFGRHFGRHYKPVETYKAEDAETLIVCMGSLCQTAMTAVDQMRAAGKKVGLARIRLFRPFPAEALFAAIKGAKTLIVLDRVTSFAGGHVSGPVAIEIKSILYDRRWYPKFRNFLVGLGGRDTTVENFEEMVDNAAASKDDGVPLAYEFINVRE